jgi:hypothetical protein
MPGPPLFQNFQTVFGHDISGQSNSTFSPGLGLPFAVMAQHDVAGAFLIKLRVIFGSRFAGERDRHEVCRKLDFRREVSPLLATAERSKGRSRESLSMIAG